MKPKLTYILEVKKVSTEVVTVEASSILEACKKYKAGNIAVMVDKCVLDTNFVSVTPEQ